MRPPRTIALVLALGLWAPPSSAWTQEPPPATTASPTPVATGDDGVPGEPPIDEVSEAERTAAGDDATTPASETADDAASTQESASLQRARELFDEATKAYELGQYPKAAKLFEEAWKLTPEPALLYNLGQSHWRWFDIDPDIEHLRKARTFFQNYDKRMRGSDDYFSGEIDAFLTALNTQIQAEEQKQAERDRPVIIGPSVDDLQRAERERLRREKNLMLAKRLNASGIALIVAGSVAAAIGIGGVIARTANKLILDNTTGAGDPTVPSLLTTEEDERRRNAYLTAGQVAYGGFIASAIFLPIGIGLRVGGAVIERRELGTAKKADDEAPKTPPPQPPVQAFVRPGALLTIEF